MNMLTSPTYNDDVALDALAENKKVKSYPALQRHVAELKAAYAQYSSVCGDANSIAPVFLPCSVANHLRDHYKSPPASLRHIDEMRNESSSKTCAMCGSLHGGTLDHLLDKHTYPAFSIFSQNLVPACLCNSKRSAALFGPNPGERILHPYFDAVLLERIVTARFSDLGPIPHVETTLMLDPAHPNFAAAAFHHDSVILRTSIRSYLTDMWIKLMQRPDGIVVDLRGNPHSKTELRTWIEDQRERIDYVRSSKNNWDSVFLSGLLEDHVIDWLFTQLTRSGRLPNAPLL